MSLMLISIKLYYLKKNYLLKNYDFENFESENLVNKVGILILDSLISLKLIYVSSIISFVKFNSFNISILAYEVTVGLLHK